MRLTSLCFLAAGAIFFACGAFWLGVAYTLTAVLVPCADAVLDMLAEDREWAKKHPLPVRGGKDGAR